MGAVLEPRFKDSGFGVNIPSSAPSQTFFTNFCHHLTYFCRRMLMQMIRIVCHKCASLKPVDIRR